MPKQALRTPHCLKLWGSRSKRFLICLPNRLLGFAVQRYYKICRCARKIAFSCDFLLGGLSPSTRLPGGTQGYSACTLSGKTITEIPEYDSGLMDKDCIEYSTTCRGNRRIFTRRTNAEHLTGRKVRGKYWMVSEWYRNGIGVVTRKKAERCRQKVGERQEEDRMEMGYSQVNNPIILRISYVYVTYILRIWYVIDSGKIGI